MSYKKLKWLSFLNMNLIALSGCTTNTVAADFCLIYQPIYADYDHDTAETVSQIDNNNLAYEELCR